MACEHQHTIRAVPSYCSLENSQQLGGYTPTQLLERRPWGRRTNPLRLRAYEVGKCVHSKLLGLREIRTDSPNLRGAAFHVLQAVCRRLIIKIYFTSYFSISVFNGYEVFKLCKVRCLVF